MNGRRGTRRAGPGPGLLLALVLTGCGAAGSAATGSPAPSASPAPSTAPPAGAGPSSASAPGGRPGAAPSAVVAPAPSVAGQGAEQVLPAVSRSGVAQPEPGVQVRIEAAEPVVAQGRGPGQVAGSPALAVRVTVRNTGRVAVPVDAVVVNATAGTPRVPASPVDGPPSAPLQGELPPGGSGSGVYVFDVPPAAREQATISVNLGGTQPTAVFDGDFSR